MFEHRFTSDKIPKSYYVCLICGELLATAYDCVDHWSKKHKDKKMKYLFCDDENATYRCDEVQARITKNARQSSLLEYLKLKNEKVV